MLVVIVAGAAAYGFALGVGGGGSTPSTSSTPSYSSSSSASTSVVQSTTTTPSYQNSSQTTSQSSQGFPQFSISVLEIFGYKWSSSAGYGIVVVSSMSPQSGQNPELLPKYLKLTTSEGGNFSNYSANATNTNCQNWSGYQGSVNCTDFILSGQVTYWSRFEFQQATQEPSLVSLEYDCAANAGSTAYYQAGPCQSTYAANATTTTFPGIRWVTFERDGPSGPIIFTSSQGGQNGNQVYNYFPDNATLHNVNYMVSTSFTGFASHEDVPGGYSLNITIPWQYTCGPQFNNVACGMTPTFSVPLSGFQIVKSSFTSNVQGAFSNYVFSLTIEFPNNAYSSYMEGGGAIPVTVSWS